VAGTIVEVQAANILPPVWNCVAQLNITTTPTIVDLTTLPSPYKSLDAEQSNVIGRYVRVTAMGNPVYYVTGSSNSNVLNALANINAANFSSVANAAGGYALTIKGTEAEPIPSGTYVDVLVPSTGGTPKVQNPPGANSACRYIALMTTANTAQVTLRQSSP
jgi:hypothetical protein